MTGKPDSPKDLIVLVADSQQERTIATLLDRRCPSLNIRKPDYEIYAHVERDAGVYEHAGTFLSNFAKQFHKALVILDATWEGCGPATEIELHIQTDLDRLGWKDRSAVIVLDPELEIWVWSDSPHVPQVLGMDWVSIRKLGTERGYWDSRAAKPKAPKDLLEEVLFSANKRRSSAFFAELATKVGLERCKDPAFVHLRKVLRDWFAREDQ